MNKTFLLFLSIFAVLSNVHAQSNDPVLMKINDRKVTKSEFEYLYNKNNTSVQQSLDEYLKLFVDYKLKVEEALDQKLDTVPSFIREFSGYKNQISQPYLIDTISEQTIARGIYDKMGESVETSHILIRLPEGKILPKDTLAAYEKALSIRNMLAGKKAKSFEDLATEFSEDPYAKQSERPGYLGWASAGMFVTPFEDAMFATKTNEVSMPVRSMFGYHLIKVHNRRPNAGKVNVSHIMFGFPSREPSAQQADSVKAVAQVVYDKLKAGGNYEELCTEYSSDKQSASRGGNMGWINEFTRLPKSFLDASYALKNTGDVTDLVKTDFGYHIIKLDGKADRDSWEDSKKQLVGQIKNSDMTNKLNILKVERIGKELDFKPNKDVYTELRVLANDYIPTDSVFIEKTANNNKVLFTANDKSFTVADFSKFVAKQPNNRTPLSTELLDVLLVNYELSVLAENEVNSLEAKHPDYRNLLREYHDGILLFNVMNAEVWEKTANDNEGLKAFFDKNRAKYNTWTAPKYKGYIIYTKDENTLKSAKKLANKNKKADDLGQILKTAFNNDSTTLVSIKKGLWAKGENKFIDSEIFKGTEKPEPLTNFPHFFVIGKTISAPEEYTDVKGQVISDLQEVREKEWMESLRAKYPVEINESVLKTIK